MTALGIKDINAAMQQVLLILVHPNLQQSKINKHLLNFAKKLEFVTIHDLCEVYPDGVIDIEQEQELLSEHDVVVFQHPFYWYSAPALLKEWFDLVLQYNYAYGPAGNQLKNKYWQSIISTGGGQMAYCPTGHNRFTMPQLLTPFEQTAYLCQMHYLPPFILHGSRKLFEDKERLATAAGQYMNLLEKLANEPESLIEKTSQGEVNNGA